MPRNTDDADSLIALKVQERLQYRRAMVVEEKVVPASLSTSSGRMTATCVSEFSPSKFKAYSTIGLTTDRNGDFNAPVQGRERSLLGQQPPLTGNNFCISSRSVFSTLHMKNPDLLREPQAKRRAFSAFARFPRLSRAIARNGFQACGLTLRARLREDAEEEVAKIHGLILVHSTLAVGLDPGGGEHRATALAVLVAPKLHRRLQDAG
jgi:hypothetical protein